MGKIVKFFHRVKIESSKVAWPEKKDVLMSALVVFIAALVMGVFILAIDYLSHGLISFLLGLGK